MNGEWTLATFFELGGVFMWPLLAFSIATIAITIERIAYFLFHNLQVGKLKSEILSEVEKGNLDSITARLAAAPRSHTPASIFHALLANAGRGEHRMEKAAETEALERIRRLENGFNYLTALASLAPITGFLGTVSGMIGAFKSIANATEVNAQLVANGIYEALITTVFGLCIAIVALVAYNLLIQKVDTFAAEITKATSDVTLAILDAQVAQK